MKCIQQDDALIFALWDRTICRFSRSTRRQFGGTDRVQAPVVKFDFVDVTFIDSTGIGFLLARQPIRFRVIG